MKVITLINTKTDEIVSQKEIANDKNAERLYEILTKYLDFNKLSVFMFDPDDEEDF